MTTKRKTRLLYKPKRTKTELRAGIYARVSTQDQQTLPNQLKAMREYVRARSYQLAIELTEVGSGAKIRPQREALMQAARRRDIDLIVVWKLDRWGRSVPDLVITLNELRELGVGFVSLTEAWTSPPRRVGQWQACFLCLLSLSVTSSESASSLALKKRARGAASMGDQRLPGFTRKQ